MKTTHDLHLQFFEPPKSTNVNHIPPTHKGFVIVLTMTNITIDYINFEDIQVKLCGIRARYI